MEGAYGLNAGRSIPGSASAVGRSQNQYTPEQQQVREKQAAAIAALQQEISARPNQPGLMDAIRGAHELIDRLNGSLNAMEDRLTPVLGPVPPQQAGGIQNQTAEPMAIEEMVRLLLRLQGSVSVVDDMTHRLRI